MGELGEEWSSNRELPTPILGPEVHGLWSKKKRRRRRHSLKSTIQEISPQSLSYDEEVEKFSVKHMRI